MLAVFVFGLIFMLDFSGMTVSIDVLKYWIGSHGKLSLGKGISVTVMGCLQLFPSCCIPY